MNLLPKRKRLLKDGQYRSRVIIRGYAVDREDSALRTLVDQHQLAARFTSIFVSAHLHRQANRFHWRFARRQTIARSVQV
jgi:hypothetical protein